MLRRHDAILCHFHDAANSLPAVSFQTKMIKENKYLKKRIRELSQMNDMYQQHFMAQAGFNIPPAPHGPPAPPGSDEEKNDDDDDDSDESGENGDTESEEE